MKKVLIGLLIALAAFGYAYAQTDANDDATVQELRDLRRKIGKVKKEVDLLMKDIVSNASTQADILVPDLGEDIRVDVLQNDSSVIVRADLPGMAKDTINITLEKSRFLKIAGSRESIKKETSPGVVRQERFSGKFEKTIELPCDVENEGIKASYKDGVLEIVIPKKAVSKEEKVKIPVL